MISWATNVVDFNHMFTRQMIHGDFLRQTIEQIVIPVNKLTEKN